MDQLPSITLYFFSFSACIKRDPIACGVEYNFKHFGIGETKEYVKLL